jgi:nucleotide-binding universal stress UspA family protein
MNKVIAAIDGLKYSHSTAEYASWFAKQLNAHLVGVLLDDFTYHSYKIYDLVTAEGVSEAQIASYEKKDEEIRKQSTEMFEDICRASGLNYSIHHDRNIAFRELIHESIYADLLIIDRKETLTHYEEKIPTRFIRDLLAEAQCPVIVAPTHFKPIDKIVLLYDGDPSSVYAIRAFSYLFPSIRDMEIEVVTVKGVKQSSHVPDNRLMKEFMKRHYPDAVYTVLKGAPETEIVHYINGQEVNALIVLGAYSRGMISRMFRESMADVLMEELNMPLFITHNK